MAVTAHVLDRVEGPELHEGDGFAAYIVGELGNEKSTAWTYEQNLLRVERFTGKSRWRIDANDIRRFFRLTDYHPSTKNGAIVAIRAFTRYRLLEERIDPAEAVKILSLKAPKQRHRHRRALSLEEVHRLLAACDSSNEHRLVFLGLYQGLRISDSAQIRLDNVTTDRLRFVTVKYRKYLELPLHAEVRRVLPIILQRDTTTRSTLKTTARALANFTGVPFTSHQLRHTYARRLDELGTQEGVAIELLGHEQVSVYRKHYAPVSWDAMAVAQRRHSYTLKVAVLANVLHPGKASVVP